MLWNQYSRLGHPHVALQLLIPGHMRSEGLYRLYLANDGTHLQLIMEIHMQQMGSFSIPKKQCVVLVFDWSDERGTRLQMKWSTADQNNMLAEEDLECVGLDWGHKYELVKWRLLECVQESKWEEILGILVIATTSYGWRCNMRH